MKQKIKQMEEEFAEKTEKYDTRIILLKKQLRSATSLKNNHMADRSADAAELVPISFFVSTSFFEFL